MVPGSGVGFSSILRPIREGFGCYREYLSAGITDLDRAFSFWCSPFLSGIIRLVFSTFLTLIGFRDFLVLYGELCRAGFLSSLVLLP